MSRSTTAAHRRCLSRRSELEFPGQLVLIDLSTAPDRLLGLTLSSSNLPHGKVAAQ